MTLAAKQQDKKENKKVLIITASGGDGHRQVARAKAIETKRNDPSITIVEKDIHRDFIGKHIGPLFTNMWNTAQLKGQFHKLQFLIHCMPLSEILLWIPIFLRSFYTFMREDFDRVIDTQPCGTSAVIKALKCSNLLRKKNLILEKVLTELPTSKASHFFKPIKKLSKKDRSALSLTSTKPLSEKNQSNLSFWKMQCGLTEDAVMYEDFPIRDHFKEYQDQKRNRSENLHVNIKVNVPEELALLKENIGLGCLKANYQNSHVEVIIEPEDLIYTIMLGSHPAQTSTLKYVKKFIALFSEKKTNVRKHLFIFCSNHHPHKETLLKKVHDLSAKTIPYPPNFTIIPMPFQDDDVIAPLFFRSDATITRSGGLTSMELMAVATGQIWIHSEAKATKQQLESFDVKEKLMGMPIWEWGNASYLRREKGAKMITPRLFSEIFSNYLIR